MIGYYDATTLTRKGDEASIAFINALDGNDIKTVDIKTAAKAAQVRDAINDQIKFGFCSDTHEIRQAKGPAHRVPFAKSEIVIVERRNRIPVRLAFKADENTLMDRSLAVAVGEYIDGAIMAAQITQAPLELQHPEQSPDSPVN